MDRFPRRLGPLIVILQLAIAGQSTFSQQDLSDKSLSELIQQALAERNTALLEHVVSTHRLQTKPYVDSLLSAAVAALLFGDSATAETCREIARATAQVFEHIHAERSLSLAVTFSENLGQSQLREKLRADSLDASGTAQRNSAATRTQALNDYREALALYQRLGDQRGQASVLGGLGATYFLMREMDSCRTYYTQALAVRTLVDDQELLGNTYNDIGYLVYWYTDKDYPRAIEYLGRSVSIRKNIGDAINLARTYSRLGNAFEDNGQTFEALEAYSNAAEIHRQAGDQGRRATALYDCGRVLRKLGNYSLALQRLEEALLIQKQLGDKRKMADVRNVLGITYRHIGDYERAYGQYEEVLALREQLEDSKGIAQISTNLGVLLRGIGRPEQAAGYLEKSLSTYRALGDSSGMLVALSNLGLAYFDDGKIDTSERCMEEALWIARQKKETEIEITNLVNLGNTKNFKGELDEGLAIYHEAHELARHRNVPGLLWPSILGTGENYELRGDHRRAYKYYAQALDIIEGVRAGLQSGQYKESFLATQRYVYEAIVHVLTVLHDRFPDEGYDAIAFEYAERGKARVFLDLMAEALSEVREGIDPELLKQQNDLLVRMSEAESDLQHQVPGTQEFLELKGQLTDLENQFDSLKGEVRRANPRYAALQYPEPSSLEEVQVSLVDQRTVILEYFVGDSSSTLWVITNEGTALFRLPDRRGLEEQVTIFRYALQSSRQDSWSALTTSGRQLYSSLLAPASQYLVGAERIQVIPDDVLHLLPFEALMTESVPKEATLDVSRLPYLTRHHAISYWPSASIAVALASGRQGRRFPGVPTLLAFGDPVFTRSDELPNRQGSEDGDEMPGSSSAAFSRLEHSGAEVRAITRFFPPDAAQIYLRSDATEANAKQQLRSCRASWVHFATHGVINETKPEFSSIVLSQDENPLEDGFLRAAEIFNLRVDADLVVLSACQTGLGKMVRGEGVVGLVRAFMYAGASSIIVSLWSVSDESTSKLMEEFYRSAVSQSMLKSQALQRTKVKMITDEQYAHPFYWAPFVLIGTSD